MASYGKVDLVKIESFEKIFKELISINGFNIEHDKELGPTLAEFKNALGKRIYFARNPQIGKVQGHQDLKTFIAIFKKYYDIEYSRVYTLTPDKKECKRIKDVIEKINLNKSSVELYLKWFWEEYKPNNTWIDDPVNIPTVISSKIVDKYFFNLDMEKRDKKGEFEESIKNDLLARLRIVIRTIQSSLDKYVAKFTKQKIVETVKTAQAFEKNNQDGELKTGNLKRFVEEWENIIKEIENPKKEDSAKTIMIA